MKSSAPMSRSTIRTGMGNRRRVGSLRLRNETEITPILPRLHILRPDCAADCEQDRSALLFSIRCFHHGIEGFTGGRLKGHPIGAVREKKKLWAFSSSYQRIGPASGYSVLRMAALIFLTPSKKVVTFSDFKMKRVTASLGAGEKLSGAMLRSGR